MTGGIKLSEDYNGWKNRETWAVMLHLDNDRGLYSDYHELYEEIINDPNSFRDEYDIIGDPQRSILYCFTDQIRAWIEDILHPNYWKEQGVDMPEWAIDMMIDVGSLWRVDFDQIGRRIVEAIKAEEPYND
tara:strand:+ start:617 stop:1009 length:393 start_codon:yes stop_codon:yes gene_type:complete